MQHKIKTNPHMFDLEHVLGIVFWKPSLLCHKPVFNPVKIKIKRMLRYFRFSWKLYFGSDYYGLVFPLFWHLKLFHFVVSCSYILPNQYPCNLHLPFEYWFHSHYYDLLLQPKVPSRHWYSEWNGRS